MIDLLEVSLLAQFVVGGARLLGDDSGLIELFLENGQLVRQLCVLAIDLGNIRKSSRELLLGLVLAPLLLKGFESLAHAKLDKEVADKLITVLGCRSP